MIIHRIILSIKVVLMLSGAFIGLLPCRADEKTTSQEADLIALAREAVRCEVLGLAPPQPKKKSRALPVFVTIERRGQVVGCRGGLRARESSLQGEVIQAARAASRHDPRYKPLAANDLKNFLVTVTIVRAMTPISRAELESLQPEDGLVLQSGNRSGIVLPWEGKEPRQRLSWAYRKAGVAQGASCRLFRLKADRFRG
jgi:AMMECR1 domain-containing protein